MSLEEKLESVEDNIEVKLLDCVDCKEFFDYVSLRRLYYEEYLNINTSFDHVFNTERENLKRKDIFLAYYNNVVVGYVIGGAFRDSVTLKTKYQSHHVYVHPNYRRRGIGKKLKKEQIRHARSLGCISITTYVDKKNIASLSLQKNFGAKIRFRGGLSYFVEIPL